MFVVVLVFTSCESITENEVNSKKNSSKLNKGITPNAMDYSVKYIDIWETEYYSPVSNKKIGVWPHSYSNEVLAELKDKYGFSMIRVYSINEYNAALNNGFLKEDLLVQLPHNKNNYQSSINSLDAGYYYIDEPLTRGTYSTVDMQYVSNYISINRSNSVLNIGDYVYTYTYQQLINSRTNFRFSCDKYGEVNAPYDQRSFWTSLRNYFGYKSNFNFVHSTRDQTTEYDELLGHASNLGQSIIFYYIGSDGNYYNTNTFCEEAWKTGWLKKFERQYRLEYRCYLANENLCDINNSWVYIQKIPTQNYREVFYNINQN
ncbi:MAG: hypothetical protein K8F60_06095 [Melioribacteraceae bacterium]|nr:hypothetical protein [Melioribacteraceae bacterium]